MGQSKIEWTGRVWNPVSGCTKIAPGCKNCYAERMAPRLAGRYGYPADEPFRAVTHPDKLKEPEGISKPSIFFACSMGDLFHEAIPDEYIRDVLQVIRKNPRHFFIVLTKRAERMRDFMATSSLMYDPLPNMANGVSVSSDEDMSLVEALCDTTTVAL